MKFDNETAYKTIFIWLGRKRRKTAISPASDITWRSVGANQERGGYPTDNLWYQSVQVSAGKCRFQILWFGSGTGFKEKGKFGLGKKINPPPGRRDRGENRREAKVNRNRHVLLRAAEIKPGTLLQCDFSRFSHFF